MTKKEIVKAISDEIGMTQLKTKEIVQKTFDAIVDTLIEEKRIELRNFGVFEVKKRAARKARNPRTGDKVFVPEKYVVTFKPGKEMEEKVRQLEEAAAKEALDKQTVATPAPVESNTRRRSLEDCLGNLPTRSLPTRLPTRSCQLDETRRKNERKTHTSREPRNSPSDPLRTSLRTLQSP